MRPCGRPAGRTMFIFLFLSHSNSLTQKLCLSLSLYLPSSDGPRVRGRQSRAFGGRRPALSRSLVSACARPYTPVRRRASRRTWVRVRGGGGGVAPPFSLGQWQLDDRHLNPCVITTPYPDISRPPPYTRPKYPLLPITVYFTVLYYSSPGTATSLRLQHDIVAWPLDDSKSDGPSRKFDL